MDIILFLLGAAGMLVTAAVLALSYLVPLLTRKPPKNPAHRTLWIVFALCFLLTVTLTFTMKMDTPPDDVRLRHLNYQGVYNQLQELSRKK